MKRCFDLAKINHAKWFKFEGKVLIIDSTKEVINIENLNYPVICKSLLGTQGNGNTKIDTREALTKWMVGKDLSNYIVEEYFNGAKEFRIHCSKNGIFSSWRKLRKEEAEERWFFNSKNCVFKKDFEKPESWKNMEKDLIKALDKLNLDIAGFDVRFKKDGTYIVLESNSACTLGDEGTELYTKEIQKLIQQKIQ